MYQGITKLFIVLFVSLAVSACATKNVLEKQIISQGGKQLNAEQARAHLSGKTQRWADGGAYFNPNGSVYVKFGGKIFPERIWTVDDDGKVCIAFRDGFKTSCSTYYRYEGKVWVVTLEVFGENLIQERPFRFRRDGTIDPEEGSVHGGPDDIVDGNRLADL